MHRAKHRAAGRASAEVLATTLIERFAVVPGSRPESTGSRHGVATLTAPDRGGPAGPLGGPALFGSPLCTAPMLAVNADDAAPLHIGSLFGGSDDVVPPCEDLVPRTRAGDSPLFGASRHARRPEPQVAPAVPGPRVPALPLGAPTLTGRSQPISNVLSVTVLGAAAAVTAAMVPPTSAVETTGSLAPVERPAPEPVLPVGPVLAAPAPAAAPDQPTMQVDELVTEVTAEMQRIEPSVAPYTTVAHAESMTSPAAVRKAAVTNALAKLGTPYRWGAMGPNAFDCSGLVKWSFRNAGKDLPRTSRAMATSGVAVKKADLQPGDLVFFYKPISHVGIYIGNGKIVHASRKGQPVKISDMSRMRFTTARRV